MKKFKLLFIAIGLMLSVQTFSQVKFGIKAGANLNNMKFDIDYDYGEEPDTKTKLGFHFGLITDISLLENSLSLQPGIMFNNKGYSLDLEEMLNDGLGTEIDDFEGFVRVNYNYIEIPINLAYKSKGFHVYAGPYFAFGIGGSMRHDFSFEADGEDFDSSDFYDEDYYVIKPVYGEVDDDKYEEYLDDDDIFDLYRGFDYGLNLGIGYQVNKLLFNVGYSVGLSNLTPDYNTDDYGMDDDFTENVIQKNRVFTFSVSYFFN